MILSKKHSALFALAVLLYAFAINEYNNYCIRKINPTNRFINGHSLAYNSAVNSIDNEWYVLHIKNYLKGDGFTIDPSKYNYEVRRTPVYPLFYGLHYVLFGEEGSYIYIRFTQMLLFIIATFALLFSAHNFTGNKKIAIISACLYGFNPSLVSYLYYTITEAVSPSLVCFLLYFLSLCYKHNQKKNWLLAGLFFSLAALCRPAIVFIAPGILFLIIYLNRKSFRNFMVSSLWISIGAAGLFAPHIIRNYIITKEFIPLEKYYGDPMDYGMPNIALRNWIACWRNPADFSSEIISNSMRNSVRLDSFPSKEKLINYEMNRLPQRALLVSSKQDIRVAYSSLYDYYKAKNDALPQYQVDSIEKKCLKEFNGLRASFIQHAPFQYYVVTPVLFFKSVIFQSNSAQLIFLEDYQDSYLKKGVKTILYLFNIYLFIALIGTLFFARRYMAIYGITFLFMLTNIIYLVFIVSYFEVRYLIPVFPLMYITGAIFLIETTRIIKQRLNF